MSRKKKTIRKIEDPHEISWERLRVIFDDPHPPREIWEKQFDRFDEELRRLALTPWEKIESRQLGYYLDDLAYVPLQPEVFNYLFPVCLMEWHRTLQRNESFGGGAGDFHYGLHRGQILSRMLSPERLLEVLRFFHDSFLHRLDQERYSGEHADFRQLHGWLHRFNSMGFVLPEIASIWNDWWSFSTPGRAVAGLIYLSGLLYPQDLSLQLEEHPFIPPWTPKGGGGGLYMACNDSTAVHEKWITDNLCFVKSELSVAFFREKLGLANSVLQGQPELRWVERIQSDLPDRLNVLVWSIPWLIQQLERPFP